MTVPSRPVLPNRDARHLFLHAHGLIARPTGPERVADLAARVALLGFVQVDSINTLAQAHDHILWSRGPATRQGALHRVAARDRTLFEGWTHDAALIPATSFQHWRHKHAADRDALSKRWEKWGRAGFHKEFDAILERLDREGPLTATEIGGGESQTRGGWWDWKPTKTALEYLWRTGEVAICHRRNFTKVYNLTERVLPPEALNARAEAGESLEWSARAALDRLGFATPSELSAFWDIFPKSALGAWARPVPEGPVPEGLVEIDVEAADGTRRTALIHADWEARVAALPAPSPRLRILNPFDPALRDRARAERLFGFAYRIEVFVPEPKRRYGYYVFPILEGLSLTGRIDMKADRRADCLRILGYWPEAGIRFGEGRATRLATELGRIARLAGVTRITVEDTQATEGLRQSAPFLAAL